MKSKGISSKDVAKEAGVSQATVSYVLNNVKGVKIKPETREAVIQAAKKLNYHPNIIARGMRLKRSMSIGIVTDKNVSNYMFMSVLEGIKDILVPLNYSITLCFTRSHDIENAEFINYYNSNRIDGVIFAFASLEDENISYMVEHNIPFAIIDNKPKPDIIHTVKNDMTNAVQSLVNQWIMEEINDISYIGFPQGKRCERKFNTYSKVLEQNSISLQEEKIFIIPTWDSEDIEETINKFLFYLLSNYTSARHAILCETTGIAFKLLRAAALNNISIPDKLSVAAIGTSKFSPDSFPSLSAIEAPLYDMGMEGAKMLIDLINGKNMNNEVNLEWVYVKRMST